jgi:NADPH2:quinone reductase
VVEAVGSAVTDLKVGDRVAYAGGPVGAYAEVRNIPADRLVKLPDAIDFKTGAAMMLQGMTAQYLLRRTCKVEPGDTILIHAAAGGVGLIVCQWARALGATVIGTVSSDEKAALAKAHGCDHTDHLHARELCRAGQGNHRWQGRARGVRLDRQGHLHGFAGVPAPLGMMVLFGAASGPVPPFDLGLLAKMGSLFITRPTLFTYIAQRSDLLAISGDLFDVVTSGKVKIEVNQTYALKDAAQAQIDLVARKTTGSTVLLP